MYLCTSEYQTDTHSAFKYVLFTFSVLCLYEKNTFYIRLYEQPCFKRTQFSPISFIKYFRITSILSRKQS